MTDEIKIITDLSPDRWAENKALRLDAVTRVPQAFGSSPDEVLKKEESFWRSRLLKSLKNDRQYWVFAEGKGELIGFMGASAEETRKLRHIASVSSVYVKEVYRGQGIATRLMEALLKKVAEDPLITRYDLMVVTTQTAEIALYTKC